MTATITPPLPVEQTEEIEGQFRPEYIQLLIALDRLLTIGSYYQPGHERYQEVVRNCQEALLTAVGGSSTLRLEITQEGFHIDDETVAGELREAKRLYGLLEPLNIGLLEIDASVEQGELHQAFSILQKVRNSVTSANAYGELEIAGLPDTVRTTHSSLYVRTRKQMPKHAPLDPSLIASELLAPDPVSQDMEKEFNAIVGGIMQTADPRMIKEFEAGKGMEDWLSPSITQSISRVLDNLGDSEEGVFSLDHLIANARAALELTGDRELVELVFSRLQRDINKTGPTKDAKVLGLPRRDDRIKDKVKFSLTLAELGVLIDGLPEPTETAVDHVGWAEGDTLGIFVQLLADDSSEETLSGMIRVLRRIINKTKLTPDVQCGMARALAGALSAENPAQVTLAMNLIWAPLKEAHADLVGALWCELWPFLTATGRDNAWPYLVNDLLTGITFKDRVHMMILLDALSRVDAFGKSQLIYKLEDLPALQEGLLAEQIFEVKPPLLYPVFKVLVGTSLSATFGPLLHCRLMLDEPNRLSSVLLECVDGYNPLNRGLYHLILDQGVRETITPELAAEAAPIIEQTLRDLHWDYLEEDWVVQAITWLGKVGREASLEVLGMILGEKKWSYLRAWPKPCRLAAREAFETLQATLQLVGHAAPSGGYEVNEDED